MAASGEITGGALATGTGHGGVGMTLHVLHTNDFHGSLNDAGEAKLRKAISDLNGAAYLLLDAGDAIKAGNVGVNPWGEPILDRMSDLGYHAMTMGNREFHVWQAALSTKINRARFPVLCANVRAKHEKGAGELPVQEAARFETGGLKVAVFGLTVPMVTEKMKAAALSQFLFDDPTETARRQVAQLRYHADVVILLSHLGVSADEKLSRDVPGIDLIVGGHSHTLLETPRQSEGAAPVVQAGWHARVYGHTELHVGQDGRCTIAAYALHPLQDKVGKVSPAKTHIAPENDR